MCLADVGHTRDAGSIFARQIHWAVQLRQLRGSSCYCCESLRKEGYSKEVVRLLVRIEMQYASQAPVEETFHFLDLSKTAPLPEDFIVYVPVHLKLPGFFAKIIDICDLII